MTRLICILVVSFMASGLFAQTYYQRHAEGWFWYVDPPPPAEEPEEQKPEPLPGLGGGAGSTDPRVALKALQEQVEIAQARAVMNPTDINAVRDYMRLQQQVSRNAETFSNTWQQVLWRNPELDSTLENPVNQQAVHLWNDERTQLMQTFLADVAKDWGIWFFFRSDCPFCERFAPVLGLFAAQHGFSVLAISQDGGAVTGFPQFVMDSGQSDLLGVSAVPATFLVNPKTREIHPLAHGMVSATDLEQRIYMSLEGEVANPLTTRFSYR